MIEYCYLQERCRSLRQGPLGPNLDGFAGLVFRLGFTRCSGRPRIRIVGYLSKWSPYYAILNKDHVSIENFVVKQIDRWVQGKDRLPEFRIMSQYIGGSPRVAPITALLFADDRYKRLRDRCNDHTHYNFYRNVLLNDKEILLEERRGALEEFLNDLRDVLILHISYMFFANGHYLMSSDHLDCLECGMAPEPDSEYWVAPFVQKIFDQTVKKCRPDIAATIKQHSCMHLV